jgi:Rieske Fe-S protein
MALGMAVSYGTAALFALRYLTPNRRPRTWRAYAGGVRDIPVGGSKTYTAPDGRKVVITNTGQGFVALSDVCPHLGCKVHWEEASQRFFCPCHGGAFDAQGVATAGPPAKAGQRLARYEIEPTDEALYITLREG